MSTLDVSAVMPNEAILPDISSSTQYILNRQKLEVVPQHTEYSPQGNSQIIIDINSPTSFVDFSNSYLRFYFHAYGQHSCNNSSWEADTRQYLAEGGMQALFENITVSTLSGTELSRLSHGNKLYSWFRNCTKSREYIDRVMWRECDSFNAITNEQEYCVYDLTSGAAIIAAFGLVTVDFTTTSTVVNLVFDAGPVSGTTIGGCGSIQVNDRIIIGNATAAQTGEMYVVSIGAHLGGVDGQTVVCNLIASNAEEGKLLVDDTVPVYMKVFRRKKNYAMRNEACKLTNTDSLAHGTSEWNPNLGGIEVCVQPFQSILMSTVWWPLFVIRGGLRITINLSHQDYVFCTGSLGYVKDWGYRIKNLQYVCDMIQPSEPLTNIYLDLFNSDRLNYHLAGFQYLPDIQTGATAGGNYTSRISPAVRSATHYICGIQDNRHKSNIGTIGANEGIGNGPAWVDSLATGLSTGLSTFQLDIGTERYPLNRPIILDDDRFNTTYNTLAEMFIEMENAFNTLGVPQASKVHSINSWAPLYVEGAELYSNLQKGYHPNVSGTSSKRESERFYICVNLARHDSPYSGVNVKDNVIQANFYFQTGPYLLYNYGTGAALSTNGLSRYFEQYIAYDSTVSIGRQGIIQRR